LIDWIFFGCVLCRGEDVLIFFDRLTSAADRQTANTHNCCCSCVRQIVAIWRAVGEWVAFNYAPSRHGFGRFACGLIIVILFICILFYGKVTACIWGSSLQLQESLISPNSTLGSNNNNRTNRLGWHEPKLRGHLRNKTKIHAVASVREASWEELGLGVTVTT